MTNRNFLKYQLLNNLDGIKTTVCYECQPIEFVLQKTEILAVKNSLVESDEI